MGGNGKNSDGRKGTAVIYRALGHRAGKAGAGWTQRRGRKERWDGTNTRSTEKGELEEGSAGIWGAAQAMPGTGNDERSYASRKQAGCESVASQLCFLWAKGNSGICCLIKWVSADSVA